MAANPKVAFTADFPRGNWVVVNDAFQGLIGPALAGGDGVKRYFERLYDRDNFLKYLQQQGPSAFQPVPQDDYVCLRAANGSYQVEIRVHVDKPADPTQKPVTEGGSIGIFLKGAIGDEEMIVQQIQATAATVADIAGAASIIADVVQRGLTKYFSSLAEKQTGTVEDAIEAASAAGSEEIEAEIGLDAAIDVLSVVEFIGIGVAICALLLILVLDLIKTMTHQLIVFNMTDADMQYAITYLYNAIPVQTMRGVLPKVRNVQDNTNPILPVTYKIASKVTFFLRNADRSRGIGYVIGLQGQRGEITVLGDIPASGTNSFMLQPGFIQDGEDFYNSITGGSNPFAPNHAIRALKLEQRMGGITATLVNDQLSGQTAYAGYSGYNYCSLLYIQSA